MPEVTATDPHRAAAAWRSPMLWGGLGALVVATAAFRVVDLDFAIVDRFYEPGQGFPFHGTVLYRVLRTAAPVMTALIGLGSLVVLLASVRVERLRRHRAMAVFLFACLAIGPGLIVNAGLKANFGRPRPFQVTRYGGEFEYRRVLEPAFHQKEESFPCGDASIGFVLAAPAFLLAGRNRRLARRFAVLGLAVGSMLGLGRVAAGGHWPSDVLWAAAIVLLVCSLLAPLFGGRGRESPSPDWR